VEIFYNKNYFKNYMVYSHPSKAAHTNLAYGCNSAYESICGRAKNK
jgi:hypothetical protein